MLVSRSPAIAANRCGGSRQPLVNLGLGLEPLDVAGFGPRIVSQDLPVALCDPVQLEGDLRLAHASHMVLFGINRQSDRIREQPPVRSGHEPDETAKAAGLADPRMLPGRAETVNE